MTRPSRIAKRLLLPVLLAATFVGVQVVLAAPPVPSFNVVGPGFTNTCGVYSFASTSTDPDNDIESYTWDLGGTPGTGPTPSATFETPGTRTITMSVTDGSLGDLDAGPETVAATPQQVTVVNEAPPKALVSATPTTAQPNQTINFSATNSSDQAPGSIAKYEWDKDGNGSYETDTGTVASTTAAFGVNGSSHTVGLQVTDNCGAKDTESVNVFINNTPPSASFTVAPNPAPLGTTVAFDGTLSSDTAPGSITKVEWDLDGNGSFETNTGTTKTASRQYTVAGSYSVKMRVTDNDGGTATAFETLTVKAKPTASFSYSPLTPLIGDQVSFDGTASSADGATIASYAWDLDGNGSFESGGPTPKHTYSAPGVVSVKLRVTDSDGTVSDVTPREVTVQATRPNAGFTYAPHDPLPGQPVTLTSTSAPSASPSAPALVATHWDLSYSPLVDFTLDGSGGSLVTSFPTPGPHSVAVKVTETGGGFAIATDTIVVNAPPQASFTVAPAKPVEGREVTFASTSIDADGPLVKHEWDLDTNGTYERSGAVVSTTKLKKGTRPVRLRVTDAKGATATSEVAVKVAGKPLKAPPNVLSTVSYIPKQWGFVLAGFRVKVPSKTKVAVSCKGPGCPKGTYRKSTKKKGATLRFTKFTGSLRAGAKISVIFSRPGHVTGWDTITVRDGKRAPARRELCKLSGAKKPKRCP